MSVKRVKRWVRCMSASAVTNPAFETSVISRQRRRAFSLVLLMLFSSVIGMQVAVWEAMAVNDQDGDGLSCLLYTSDAADE